MTKMPHNLQIGKFQAETTSAIPSGSGCKMAVLGMVATAIGLCSSITKTVLNTGVIVYHPPNHAKH